jgi:hypothetical protein
MAATVNTQSVLISTMKESILCFYSNIRNILMDELEQLKKENARLVEELKRLYGVERPFICGEAGPAGADGFKEYILVCPMYGADGFAMYKKHKDYSAPEY